jgi:hypothetical protein
LAGTVELDLDVSDELEFFDGFDHEVDVLRCDRVEFEDEFLVV